MMGCVPTAAVPVKMPDGQMFDAEYYTANNPDAVQTVGSNKDALPCIATSCCMAGGKGVCHMRECFLVVRIWTQKQVPFVTSGHQLLQTPMRVLRQRSGRAIWCTTPVPAFRTTGKQISSQHTENRSTPCIREMSL